MPRRPATDRQPRPTATATHIEPLEGRAMMSAGGWIKTLAAEGWTSAELNGYRHELREYRARHAAAAGHAARRPLGDPFKYTLAVPGAPVVRSAGAAAPLVTYSPVVGAYSPIQVQTAYGVGALGTADQGQGMTIGIVDEFDDPNITSDANVFSAQYGLPQFNATGGPTLTVTKDTALGAVTSAAGTGVAGETSLDVEWAHAIAPRANLLLVEVPATGSNANLFAQLLHGVQVAAQAGAQAVSLSYGLSEATIGASSVVSENATYLASGTAASQTVVTVSTGDRSTPLFPATSPNVVAVGGSSLYLASAKGKYGYETAWGGLAGAGAGGGGTSTNFATPTFQSGNGVNYGNRSIPDVALIADPVTAVSTYDSLDVTSQYPDPWGATGGTSLAAPVFAGMVTLAQQTRVATGKAILTSAQVDAEIYAVYNSASYSTYFHDIRLGNNAYRGSPANVTGYSATAGYDEATGVGSPIASTFVPLLATI